MGCSASRPDTLLSSVPRTISLPNHFVHHPPVKKGDTHHLVSLTSTTYGSLILIEEENSNHSKHLTSSSSSFSSSSTPTKLQNNHFEEYPSPDSVINTWELMAGLDEGLDHFEASPSLDKVKRSQLDKSKTSLVNGKVKKNYRDSYQSMKMNYFDISDVHEVPLENSTKPLWQHLSEELILAEMDSNVVSSFRKAELAKKIGFNHNKIMRSPVCEDKVMHLVDNKVQLPGTEDRIVIYYTSLRGIRRTYEDCCIVRTIFKGLRVPVDERDIIMDSAYRKELQTALDKSSVSLPQVFIKGGYLGGVEEVKQLHEDGELAKLVQDFPVQDPGFVCENCGDARFVPCSSCSGSRKVFVEEDGQLTRCLDCNENGLLRCPSCCS